MGEADEKAADQADDDGESFSREMIANCEQRKAGKEETQAMKTAVSAQPRVCQVQAPQEERRCQEKVFGWFCKVLSGNRHGGNSQQDRHAEAMQAAGCGDRNTQMVGKAEGGVHGLGEPITGRHRARKQQCPTPPPG